MDQWSLSRAAAHQTQQPALSHVQQQQGVAQYSYSSSSYSGQQAVAPPSAASAAYSQQAYSQQAYAQQSYAQQQPAAAPVQAGYASNATYGAPTGGIQQPSAAQQQQVAWSQQASAQGAQQADQSQGAYGRSSTGVSAVPASGGGSVSAAGQYGGQYGTVYASPAQGTNQQLLGASGRGVTSTEEYQAQVTVATRGSTAYGTIQDRATIPSGASYVVGGASAVSASGVYSASDGSKYSETPQYGDIAKYGGSASSAGYVGKASDYGGASSPTAYSQKAVADQYGASYSVKSSDYASSERGQYGQTPSTYGQGEAQGDTARRYQDAHAAVAVAQQRQQQERQDHQSHILRQQQALQLQASMINRGAASSPLDGATRTQGDYLGRGGGMRGTGSQDYGGTPRGMLGGNYGNNRAEAELVAQYGGGGRGGRSAGAGTGYSGSQQASGYGGLAGGRGLGGQMYGGHNVPGMGYGGVQLPPGRDYSVGRGGAYSGQRESSYGGGGGNRSDRPSIGSSRNDDRRDQRPPFRGERRRDEGGRRRDRDRRNRGGGVSGGGGGGPGAHDREDRERGRDRDRERREEERKRERSPALRASHDRKLSPAGDRDDRSRKESPRRDGSYRHTSPSKDKRREYVCKIEPYSVVEAERDYLSICKRYSKLYVVPEFSKLVACWVGKDVEVPINQPISFEHEAVDIEDEGESTKEAPPKISDKGLPSSASATSPPTTTTTKPALQSTTWNAKVMLMSGLTDEAFAEFLSEKSAEDKPAHLHNLLKFVALRKDRSAIMAAGGAWDLELDGGDPATDEDALVRAAIRCTKESSQLDLSRCKKWTRFLEVHYERLGEDGLPSHREITVMFLPHLADCVPSLEDWQIQWTERQQAQLDHEAATKEKEEKSPEKDEHPKEGESNGVKDTIVGQELAAEGTRPENDEKPENNDIPEDKKDELVDAANKPRLENSRDQVKVENMVLPLPGLVLTTKCTKATKMRSMTISLDGLLDYDEEDREDCTFELSLFAELFQELLQFKMGSQILSNLEMLREVSYANQREERKRKNDTERETDAEGSSSQRKRSKFSDKPEAVEGKSETEVVVETDLKIEEEPIKAKEKIEENGILEEKIEEGASKDQLEVGDLQLAAIENNTEIKEVKFEESKDEEEPKGETKVMEDGDAEMRDASEICELEIEKVEHARVEKKLVLDQELLRAYRYFDKNRVGYLKSEDLRRLFHSLGKFLSHRNVKDLVGCAVMESNKSPRDERVVYRTFTEKEVVVEMMVSE